MYMFTFILDGKKDTLCVQCKAIETAVEAVHPDAKIIDWERLY
jgi:hypothetical protein